MSTPFPKPVCGPQGPPSNDPALTTALGWVSILTTTGNLIMGIIAPNATVAAAIAGLIVIATVAGFYYARCRDNPKGIQACSAGVIEEIVPAFSSTLDSVFPFISLHDRVDVVVKSNYFYLVATGAQFVKCTKPTIPVARNSGSPIMQCFYHNEAVCNAGIGAIVGTSVGAVAGLLIAAAAIAAIGCAIWILCLLALIVAVIIVVVAAVLGAAAGGSIGKAATKTQVPSSTGSPLIPPSPLSVGDYVTTQGNVIRFLELEGANVYWFVESTALHGHSSNQPPFGFTDPDINLPFDACPGTSLIP